MSSSQRIGDRGGRNQVTRLVLRLIGVSLITYLLVAQHAFAGPFWIALASGLALAAAYSLEFLRVWRPYDRISVALTLLMMLLGVVVNASLANLGLAFVILGGITLLGQPEVPIRWTLIITGVVGGALVITATILDPGWPVLLSNLFGVAAVVLFGMNRRQRVIQDAQDRALAARSVELEQRNAELLEQTEKTRQEAARAAALEERGRIARDIHDVLAHSLGGLVVQLDAAEAELTRVSSTGPQHEGIDAALSRLHTSRSLAVDGLREAKVAVNELRPDRQPGRSAGSTGDPTFSSLTDAVQAVVRGPVGLHLGAYLEVVGDPRPVPDPVVAALGATTREALTNVNKHAPGSQVSVTILFEAHRVTVEIVNGLVGPAIGDLAGTGAGAGITGLTERLAAVGGRVRAGPEGRRWVVAAQCPVGDVR